MTRQAQVDYLLRQYNDKVRTMTLREKTEFVTVTMTREEAEAVCEQLKLAWHHSVQGCDNEIAGSRVRHRIEELLKGTR